MPPVRNGPFLGIGCFQMRVSRKIDSSYVIGGSSEKVIRCFLCRVNFIPKYEGDFGRQQQMVMQHFATEMHSDRCRTYSVKLEKRRRKRALPWLRMWWQFVIRMMNFQRKQRRVFSLRALRQVMRSWRSWLQFKQVMLNLAVHKGSLYVVRLVKTWRMSRIRKNIVIQWFRELWKLFRKAYWLMKALYQRTTVMALRQLLVKWRKVTFFHIRVRRAVTHFFHEEIS